MTGLTAAEVKAEVCKRWVAISYDSEIDDQQTIDEVRVNNAKRDGFCA